MISLSDAGTGPLARAELIMLRALNDLHQLEEVEALLRAGLDAACAACEARGGVVALWDPGLPELRWEAVVGLPGQPDEVAAARLSRSVAGEARESGAVVNTVALDDPRFHDQESIRDQAIRGVLCVPFPDDVGVLYLEADGAFSSDRVALAVRAARAMGSHARRHLAEARLARTAPDRTAALRADMVGTHRLVGHGPATAALLQGIRRCARMRDPVLLRGASGSGKTTVARVLHDNSARRDGPFVAVNCATLDPQLLEARLFGTRRGGFTGAVDREGLVAEADGGTLFLDEVADLPAEAQVRLLGFLDDGRYRRVGEAEERAGDVRLVAATDQDLDAAVESGSFRAALLFRLRRLQVRVPSLEARREDIPALSAALVARACERNGIARIPLGPEALDAVTGAGWPGNVRQLDAVLTEGLSRALDRGRPAIGPEDLSLPTAGLRPCTWREGLAAAQRRLLSEALAATGGTRTAAAERLGLSRSRLYELLAEHDLR